MINFLKKLDSKNSKLNREREFIQNAILLETVDTIPAQYVYDNWTDVNFLVQLELVHLASDFETYSDFNDLLYKTFGDMIDQKNQQVGQQIEFLESIFTTLGKETEKLLTSIGKIAKNYSKQLFLVCAITGAVVIPISAQNHARHDSIIKTNSFMNSDKDTSKGFTLYYNRNETTIATHSNKNFDFVVIEYWIENADTSASLLVHHDEFKPVIEGSQIIVANIGKLLPDNTKRIKLVKVESM